jgi:hypothetical protein
MSSRIAEIIQQIRTLPPNELSELRQTLPSVIEQATSETQAPSRSEDEFEQEMESKGFLRRALPPVTDLSPYENYHPIKVQGHPLSEMIVEERR